MADITMCSGDNCPIRDRCYRHTASAGVYRQAYFVAPPYDSEIGSCVYFSPIHKVTAEYGTNGFGATPIGVLP